MIEKGGITENCIVVSPEKESIQNVSTPLGFGGEFEKGNKLKNIAVAFLIGESIFPEKGLRGKGFSL